MTCSSMRNAPLAAAPPPTPRKSKRSGCACSSYGMALSPCRASSEPASAMQRTESSGEGMTLVVNAAMSGKDVRTTSEVLDGPKQPAVLMREAFQTEGDGGNLNAVADKFMAALVAAEGVGPDSM